MTLEPATQQFIVHWGEMGTRWGINRSVAQIHALLYLAGQPLAADEIAATLAIARSNVSTGLRELQGWGLVRIVHHLGDRRDHFETLDDVWETFRLILRERKRRELDPTVEVVRACTATARQDPAQAATATRLGAMLEFLEVADSWGERASRLSGPRLRRLSRLSDAIFKLAD